MASPNHTPAPSPESGRSWSDWITGRAGGLLASVVLALGVTTSLVAWWFVGRWEQQKAQSEFEIDAQRAVAAIQLEIDSGIEALHAVRSLYDSSVSVERAEFATFVNDSLNRHKSLRTMGWFERVDGGQREAFQRAAVEGGLPAFRITRRAESGRVIESPPAAEHFVTWFIEPFESFAHVIGFDQKSDPDRAAAMLRAAATGEVALTAPLELLAGTVGERGVLAVIPVYAQGADLSTEAARLNHLRGFVGATFIVADLVDTAAAPWQNRTMRIGLHDALAPEASRDLYPRRGVPAPAGTATVDADLDVGGRRWTVRCEPTIQWFRTPASWGVLAGGVLISCALAVGVASVSGRSRIERLVERGARELAEAHRKLAAQAAERDRSERTARESQSLLTTLISHLPGVAYRGRIDRDRSMALLSDGVISLTGYAAADFIETRRVTWSGITHPDDLDHTRRTIEIAVREGRSYELSYRIRVASGEERWVWERGRCVERDPWGAAVIEGFIADVTDRKNAEHRQRQLMRERDEQIKGNMEAMLAIVEQTLDSSESLEQFAETFRGRLRAMERLHEVLSSSRWTGADLATLVKQTVEPYTAEREGRVVVVGEPLTLPAQAVAGVSMALHELATNAAKFGALSVPDGRVEIRWSREHDSQGHEVLRLQWIEGGLTDEEVQRELLRDLSDLERAIDSSGRTRLEFSPEGVRCELVVNLN